MRRIQSSAQLLERQRNPGVGYWSGSNAASTPTSATPGRVTSPGGASSPTTSVRGSVDVQCSGASTPVGKTGIPAAAQSAQDEEEVNLEVGRFSCCGCRKPLTHDSFRAVSQKCHLAVFGTQGDESKSQSLRICPRSRLLTVGFRPFLQPNLVRVLTVILRFTPQETRRLNAKLTA